MPRTIQHETPLLAVVFLDNGDAVTHAECNEEGANQWIDRKLHQYGVRIVASDIIPNIVEIG